MVTRAEWVTTRLREMIVRGDMSPGDRLQEEALAAVLGVSRTPLRSGLMTLTHEGILEYAVNRGYTVRRLEFREIRDAYLVRAALESMAVRIVAERGLPDSHERRLRRALETGDAIVTRETLTAFQVKSLVSLNEVFHSTLLDAAENPLLREMADKAQRIPLASLLTKPVWGGGAMESVDPRQSHYEHRAIHDAMRHRNVDAAERLMRDHIQGALALLSEQYRQTSANPSVAQGRRTGGPRRKKPRRG